MLAKGETRAERDVLSTARLSLVPLSPRHASALHALMNDWEVVRMLAVVPWPLPFAEVESFARAHAEGRTVSDEFAILLDRAPIGVGAVKRPGEGNPPRKMPRLGYWIGRPHWGQGYATEAISALIAYAFETFPNDRLGAGVFADNPASRRVQEKCGLRKVGHYALHCRSRGEEVETDDMQLTRADWERAR